MKKLVIVFLILYACSSAPEVDIGEVANHNTPEDCWIMIDGNTYAISDYLDEHEGADLAKHCGRDATEAFREKPDGEPHSEDAQKLLETYRIGET